MSALPSIRALRALQALQALQGAKLRCQYPVPVPFPTLESSLQSV